MARRAFFSFHYQRDIWRVGQVRNCWVAQPNRETAGFWDAAAWEKIRKSGEEAVERWINDQLRGTSVTVVLIGAETSQRKFVNYEIKRSHEEGKGLLGIYIHNIKDQGGKTDFRGANPFDGWSITRNGQKVRFSQIYKTYDWVADDGRNNIGAWIEVAATAAGK